MYTHRSHACNALDTRKRTFTQSEQLQREVEMLEIQRERNAELHQIELEERDQQLAQLRRQLKYAVAEEEETRRELKALTTESSNERLKMQKTIVELDSKLQFVDATLNEWKEKALESASELRTVSRQSKMKVRACVNSHCGKWIGEPVHCDGVCV